jgi:male germ cell-associated kinase
MERYRVLCELGDGAFGSVLKAEHVESGEIVAIKRLKKTYATWEECLALREVHSLTKLKHPAIVK